VVVLHQNVDPVGVHGRLDHWRARLTLTDRECQNLRNIGIGIIRAVGSTLADAMISSAIPTRPMDASSSSR
jgi:carbamoylphosphate synthase large subunit